MRVLPVVVLAVLLVALVPSARAWTLGPGIVIASDTVTTYTTGATIEVISTLEYESSVGALILNGFVIDLAPMDGTTPYDWTLLAAALDNVTLHGNTTVNGTFHFAGFNGLWLVTGVYGLDPFTISAPTAAFFVPAGNQTITLTPVGALLSGPRLAMDAAWSLETSMLNVVVVLSQADGTALSGEAADIAGTIFAASGPPAVLASLTFTESPTPGIYYGGFNLTASPTLTGYLVTTQWGDLTGGRTVPVTGFLPAVVSVDTALDTFLPIVVWGGLALWFARKDAWTPFWAALGVALATVASPASWTWVNPATSTLVVALALALHFIVTSGAGMGQPRSLGDPRGPGARR